MWPFCRAVRALARVVVLLLTCLWINLTQGAVRNGGIDIPCEITAADYGFNVEAHGPVLDAGIEGIRLLP